MSYEIYYYILSVQPAVTVSTEGHGSVNERVLHHWVVSGVLGDAQTSVIESRTRVQKLR